MIMLVNMKRNCGAILKVINYLNGDGAIIPKKTMVTGG
jgi:hypothetical protein